MQINRVVIFGSLLAIILFFIFMPYLIPKFTVTYSPFLSQVFIAQKIGNYNKEFKNRINDEREMPYGLVKSYMNTDDKKSQTVALDTIWIKVGITPQLLDVGKIDKALKEKIENNGINDVIYERIVNHPQDKMHNAQQITMIILQDERIYSYIVPNLIPKNDFSLLFVAELLERYPLSKEQCDKLNNFKNIN